jgi:regulator of RNase E activity RraB
MKRLHVSLKEEREILSNLAFRAFKWGFEVADTKTAPTEKELDKQFAELVNSAIRELWSAENR